MKKRTLGMLFGEMRAASELSMLAVGEKCGLSESTVWKVERDRPVRWETVHLILAKAFNIRPLNDEYQAFNLLWMKQHAETANAQPEGHASKTLSKHAVEATRKFRNLVRDLDPAETKTVLAAAQRSAAKLS